MKTSLPNAALVAVACLALGAPVALHAQTDTTNPIATAPVTAPSAKKMAKTPYKGTLKSVDATGASIVVTTAKGDITLAVDAKTKIKNNKKTAKLSDITVGEKVTGSFTTDATGALTAASIHGHTK